MSFQTKAIPPVNPSTSWAGCCHGDGPCASCGDRPWWDGRDSCEDDGDDILCLDWPDGGRPYCPAYGPVASAESQGNQSQRIKCTYSSINPEYVFDAGVATNFESDVVNGPNGYRATFCKSITDPATLVQKKSDCLPFFGGGSEEVFNGAVINLCSTKPNWRDIPECFNIVRTEAQKGEVNATAAVNLIKQYCRGGDGSKTAMGPNRSKQECACINASDFGFKDPTKSCLAPDKKALPGCDKINLKLGSLVESGGPGMQVIQAITNDSGCLTEDCAEARKSGSDVVIFPYQPNTATCPSVDLNVCNIAITQRVGYNSPILTSCNFPKDGAGAAGTPGAAGAPGPSSAAGPDTEGELPVTWKPFAKIFNTETKQYAFFSSCCVTCLLLILVMMFMSRRGPSGQNILAAKLATL